jgi:hypothetical protein
MPARRNRFPVQYLGVRGDTHSCVDAMMTILTGSHRCREITVVFCRPRPQPNPGRGHHRVTYAVLFVVWDWLDCDITIVPDGFGTHHGTGGWGLAVVLDLIQFYRVPLSEKWVDEERFDRIADGFPTERDVKELHQQDHVAPSWPLYQGEFGPKFWVDLYPGGPWAFPYWLMEPELMEDVRGAEQDPDGAVFRAVKRLEVILRQMGDYDASILGLDLVNKAMGNQGQFVPHGETESERIAWANLFRGAMGAFKNPQSHRDVKLSEFEATEQILAVNLLIGKLKHDFPDRFPHREEEPEGSMMAWPRVGYEDANESDEDVEESDESAVGAEDAGQSGGDAE